MFSKYNTKWHSVNQSVRNSGVHSSEVLLYIQAVGCGDLSVCSLIHYALCQLNYVAETSRFARGNRFSIAEHQG